MTEVVEPIVAPVEGAHVPARVTPVEGRGQVQLVNDLGAVQEPEFVSPPDEQGLALGFDLVRSVLVDADHVAEVKLEAGTGVSREELWIGWVLDLL